MLGLVVSLREAISVCLIIGATPAFQAAVPVCASCFPFSMLCDALTFEASLSTEMLPLPRPANF